MTDPTNPIDPTIIEPTIIDPTITTDQLDYAPGTTANITAADFGAGDTVEITAQVVEADGSLASVTFDESLVVGSDGTATTTMPIDPSIYTDQTILLTATDLTNGAVATEVFADAPVPTLTDLTTTSGTVNTAVFTNTAAGPSGTGNFNAFLGIQNTGTEQGYNTDHTPTPLDDKSVASVHTGSLLLGNVPLVYADGHAVDGSESGPAYREFILDINQTGSLGSSNSDITLNSLQVYLAGAGNNALTATGPFTSTGGAFGSSVPLVYDLGNNSVLLSDHASGSGKFDYKILIPDSDFTAKGGTDSSTDGHYVYLYSQFSGANGGFEEWGVSAPSSTTPGSTPDAVVSIDKQISVDGGTTWLDQGLYGTVTGSDTAPTVLAGSTVTYQVLITNDTTPNASDLDPAMLVTSLTDNPTLTWTWTYQSGDANNNGLIDLGETWTYTASTTAVDGLQPGGNGQTLQLDTATVVGSVTTPGTTPGTTTDTNSDAANYIGVTPSITIDKLVSVDGGATYVDSDTATGPILLSVPGAANPMFEYVVTNTGDVALAAPTVTDNTGLTPVYASGDTNSNGLLDPGETWTYTATGTWAAGQNTNIGEAKDSFTDDAGHTAPLDVTAPANYFGAAPSITIVKEVSVDGGTTWFDANSPTGPTLLAGHANPMFEYIVTNTGNVDLAAPTVTDDKLGAITAYTGDNGDGILNVGETWTYTANGSWNAGQNTNTGEAKDSYTDSASNTANLDVTDPANYFGAAPSIKIEKDVSVDGGTTWFDANTATGPTLLTGFASPEYKIVVTNNGNVDLSNIQVTDPTLGLSFTISSLAAGSSSTPDIVTGTWAAGQQANTAEAKGSYTDTASNTVNLDVTDPANYFGLAPAVNVEKLVSVDGGANWYFTAVPGDPYDTAAYISSVTGIGTGHLFSGTPSTISGASVNYEFVVTNTGNVDLTNVVLHDVNNVTHTTVDLNGAATGTDIMIASLAVGSPAYIATIATTATTGVANMDTATATAGTITDTAGDHVTPTDSDAAAYTGLAPALPGLTAGFWGQHQLDWNGLPSDDSKAANLVSAHTLSSTDVNPLTNELLLGDVNHNGVADVGEHTLLLPLLAAQEIITQSTAGDAHVIMLNQLIASQLNDYNDGGNEPNGLIEAGVKWITTAYAAGTLTGGNVDTNHDGILETQSISAKGTVTNLSTSITNLTTATIEQLYAGESVAGAGISAGTTITGVGTTSITINHAATSTNANDILTFAPPSTTEYNTSTQLFSSALSTSSPAWAALSSVFNESSNSYTAVDGHQYNVTADGEGLKNALEAYNQGQLVISANGSLVGWNSGSGITDVHANTAGAFWGILEDQNLAHPNTVIGVAHA